MSREHLQTPEEQSTAVLEDHVDLSSSPFSGFIGDDDALHNHADDVAIDWARRTPQKKRSGIDTASGNYSQSFLNNSIGMISPSVAPLYSSPSMANIGAGPSGGYTTPGNLGVTTDHPATENMTPHGTPTPRPSKKRGYGALGIESPAGHSPMFKKHAGIGRIASVASIHSSPGRMPRSREVTGSSWHGSVGIMTPNPALNTQLYPPRQEVDRNVSNMSMMSDASQIIRTPHAGSSQLPYQSSGSYTTWDDPSVDQATLSYQPTGLTFDVPPGSYPSSGFNDASWSNNLPAQDGSAYYLHQSGVYTGNLHSIPETSEATPLMTSGTPDLSWTNNIPGSSTMPTQGHMSTPLQPGPSQFAPTLHNNVVMGGYPRYPPYPENALASHLRHTPGSNGSYNLDTIATSTVFGRSISYHQPSAPSTPGLGGSRLTRSISTNAYHHNPVADTFGQGGLFGTPIQVPASAPMAATTSLPVDSTVSYATAPAMLNTGYVGMGELSGPYQTQMVAFPPSAAAFDPSLVTPTGTISTTNTPTTTPRKKRTNPPQVGERLKPGPRPGKKTEEKTSKKKGGKKTTPPAGEEGRKADLTIAVPTPAASSSVASSNPATGSSADSSSASAHPTSIDPRQLHGDSPSSAMSAIPSVGSSGRAAGPLQLQQAAALAQNRLNQARADPNTDAEALVAQLGPGFSSNQPTAAPTNGMNGQPKLEMAPATATKGSKSKLSDAVIATFYEVVWNPIGEDGKPIDGKRFKCKVDDCPRLFPRKSAVVSHIQTHLGDKPHECSECDAAFVRQHDLRRHEKTHKENKEYMCACLRGFSRGDALQRHKQHHTTAKFLAAHPNAVQIPGDDEDDLPLPAPHPRGAQHANLGQPGGYVGSSLTYHPDPNNVNFGYLHAFPGNMAPPVHCPPPPAPPHMLQPPPHAAGPSNQMAAYNSHYPMAPGPVTIRTEADIPGRYDFQVNMSGTQQAPSQWQH